VPEQHQREMFNEFTSMFRLVTNFLLRCVRDENAKFSKLHKTAFGV